jgi:hypothetical protein
MCKHVHITAALDPFQPELRTIDKGLSYGLLDSTLSPLHLFMQLYPQADITVCIVCACI